MEKAKEDGYLYSQLRKFINVIDELRDVGLQEHISLPRIAVLGQQSSGKSSVLENIVGIDMLPRGAGLCTRRPLEMRLNHLYEDDAKPWATFDELPGQKFTDFKKVTAAIEELTDKVAGTNKGIVDSPIVVHVYSPTCPDLTLIDLPGLTRIPLAGSDHPENIYDIVKDMALKYIDDPRTIILCVIPANADITASDALQLAKQIDVKGIRTIGVITKIDIMDAGTNARRMLLGQDVPLRLGYVGVKNRSQQDIIDKKSVLKALNDEREFFENHPIYSSLNQNILGTEILTQKCTRIMFTHIKTHLPDIMREIKDKMNQINDRLKDLGPPMPSLPKEKAHLLYNMVTEFCNLFKSTISGKYDARRDRTTKEIYGGARLKMLLENLYREFTGKYRATKDLTDLDIEKAIIMHEGDSLPGFPSVDVFIYLITPELKKLADPALDLLSECHLYIEQLAEEIAQKVFSRFPGVVGDIMEIVSRVLLNQKDKSCKVVQAIIQSEEGYLFTNDKEYMEKCTDIVPSDDSEDKEAPKKTSRNQSYVNEIRKRLDMYFRIIVRGIRDSVPKAIGFFLINGIQETIQYELYAEINKNESLAETLGEPPEVTAERQTLNTSSETMKQALKVLQRDPEITATLDYDDELSRDIKESLKDAKKKESKEKHREELKAQSIDPSRLNLSMMSGTSDSTHQSRVPQDSNASMRSNQSNRMPQGANLQRKPAQGPV
jgi:vacuolar protein sorting-associated protein 1